MPMAHRPITPETYLADLQRVAARYRAGLTQTQYLAGGHFSTTPAFRHWGSWNGALIAAGITPRAPSHAMSEETKRRQRDAVVRRRTPVTTTSRPCLRCDRRFPSAGAHNRLCDRCRYAIEYGHLRDQAEEVA